MFAYIFQHGNTGEILPYKFVGISFPTDYLLSNSTAQASGSYGYAQFGAGSLRGLLWGSSPILNLSLHSENKPAYWKKEDFLLPLMKTESSLLISSGISISTDSKVSVSDITVLVQKHMFSGLEHRWQEFKTIIMQIRESDWKLSACYSILQQPLFSCW